MMQGKSWKTVLAMLLCLTLIGISPPGEVQGADGIILRSWSTGVNGGTDGEDDSQITVARPATVVAGDVLLAQIAFEKGSDIQTVVAPSGWTLVIRNNRINDVGQAIFSKMAGSSEPASYQWQFRKSDSEFEYVRAAGGIMAFSGVDRSMPVAGASGGVGDAGTLTAPSIQAPAGSTLLSLYGYKKQVTLTPAGSAQKIYQHQHINQSGPTIMVAREHWTSVGDTGVRSAAYSPSDQSDKWVAQLIALKPATTSGTPATPTPDITVYVDGSHLMLDTDPLLESGRTLVPMRGLFEALGATVQWDNNSKVATGLRGGITVRIQVSSTTPTVNGIVVTIDVPARIINGRTYIPLRFVSEALGDGVHYDGATRRIDVTRK